MCLIAFAWKTHADFPLIVAANRDEWHDRPAAPAAWWGDHPDLLAGRDLQAGGTWMGVTRRGRFGAITNFRDPSDRKSTAPSRGNLVVDYLCGDESPRAFLEALLPNAHRYNGFNLLLAENDSLFYFGSREGLIMEVPPGVHALSNHLLDEPWPKVEFAKSSIGAASRAFSAGTPLPEPFFDFLSNDTHAPDARLPDTGVGLEWERVLSPALIVSEKYGTRCSTVVALGRSGQIHFEERTRGRDGKVGLTTTFHFQRG